MKVTARTRDALAYRRQARDLLARGYELVGENGGKLWELHRGWRTDHRITSVEIGVSGDVLYVKVVPRKKAKEDQ